MRVENPPWEGANLGSCPAFGKALGVSAVVHAAKGIIRPQ